MQTFGIPAANIFNSRSTTFAAELMRATNGYGVDVILNSLTGDLLDESWRCIANGGTMVELGKKVNSNPVANRKQMLNFYPFRTCLIVTTCLWSLSDEMPLSAVLTCPMSTFPML